MQTNYTKHQNPILLSIARDIASHGHALPLVMGNTLYCPVDPNMQDNDAAYLVSEMCGLNADMWIFVEEHPGYMILEHPGS